MRILIVGAQGTIGKAVVEELATRHEIITAGRTTGTVHVDLMDQDSIRTMYEQIGIVDAVIACTGHTKWSYFPDMSHEDYIFGIEDKLMGQVNLVRIGLEYVSPGGSFTLTSGVTDDVAVPMGSSASMVAGALRSFVMAAATEMPNGLRLNLVSPGVILEAMDKYAPFFRGHQPVPAARAALAYAMSVESRQNGQTYKIVL
ncbi:short chain dehydrogenase [Maribrevibacterium harenarium]|uniref:Short chain dehydrogenase n=1 Tax=Maribrevibacterium harenarium TaxID=2589817 RepID=A0A501WHV1_9GAMM|nr:short chain dehydrogenase [Maribrevibacterium harenarium]TPE49463.1 short chain dehydrogenase [Maribrevibacterium harenarium]